MEEARELLKKGRSFRYEFDEPYRPQAPSETEQQQAGDCKDKSLWLMDRMDDSSVRFVVGKAQRGSSMSHAWLLWQKEGRWWILDPTSKAEPIAAESVGKNSYLPLYSFTRNGKRVHGVAGSARTQVQIAHPAVAGRR
jgi:transglutaminase-like putative cysteine protease